MLSHRDDFLFPIESHFNKIFDELISSNGNKLKDSVKSISGYPKMDVVEDNGYLLIKCALPGMKLEDIIVEFEHNDKTYPASLSISGKMSKSYENSKEARYYVKELRQSSFSRQFVLPKYVTEQPEAFLEDGILTLKWKIPELKTLKISDKNKVIIKQIKN
jgi:HSP20 family molecular chaperone IbpA